MKSAPPQESVLFNEIMAENYRYRPPYHEAFFRSIANNTGLSRDHNVLDLCTGQGEVAYGISGFVNHVMAVDKSQEMLKFSRQSDNISYLCADINGIDFIRLISGRSFSHVLIGSGVHWIDGRLLASIGREFMSEPRFLIATLRAMSRRNIWWTDYRDVLGQFGSRNGQRADRDIKGKLGRAHFDAVNILTFRYSAKIGLDILVRDALSRTSWSSHIIGKEDEVLRAFEDRLDRYTSDGKLEVEVLCIAEIYKYGHTRAKG